MNQEERTKLINLSLDEKIKHAKNIIKDAYHRFGRDDFYIAWTGGKDSTTMVWLLRQVCKESDQPMPKAMFIDEGHVFEEILELVEDVKTHWNIEVAVVKNTDVSDRAQNIGDEIRDAECGKLKTKHKTPNLKPEPRKAQTATLRLTIFLNSAFRIPNSIFERPRTIDPILYTLQSAIRNPKSEIRRCICLTPL